MLLSLLRNPWAVGAIDALVFLLLWVSVASLLGYGNDLSSLVASLTLGFGASIVFWWGFNAAPTFAQSDYTWLSIVGQGMGWGAFLAFVTGSCFVLFGTNLLGATPFRFGALIDVSLVVSTATLVGSTIGGASAIAVCLANCALFGVNLPLHAKQVRHARPLG